MRTCRGCGCTELEPCVNKTLGITCGWYSPTLCTWCVEDAREFGHLESDEVVARERDAEGFAFDPSNEAGESIVLDPSTGLISEG